MSPSFPRVLSIIVAGLSLASCGRGAPAEVVVLAPEAVEVIVEPPELELAAGSTAVLSAQADDSRGQAIGGASFRLTTADERMLQVRPNGRITALGPVGEATVVVTSGRVERRVPVRILPGPVSRIEILEGDGQTAVAGQPPTAPLVARAVDAFGNPVARVDLTLEFGAEGQAPLAGPTDAQGTRSFLLPALSRAGRVPLKLVAPSMPHVQGAATLQVQPAVGATITPLTGTGLVLEYAEPRRSPALSWQVHDAYGNPVSAAVVHFRVQRGPGGVEPVEGLTNDQGLVSSVWSGDAASVTDVDIEAALESDPPVRSVLTLQLQANPAKNTVSERSSRKTGKT